MEDKKPFRVDFTLTLVLAAVALVGLFRPPQTGSWATAWLLVLLLLGIYPVLHLADWAFTNKLLGRWCTLGIWVAMIVGFGWRAWPYTLEAKPGKLVFHDNLPGGLDERYPISLANKSDHDIYVAELDITIANPDRSPRMFFDIEPSASSRKPIGGATGDAARLTDIIGGLCHDESMNAIYRLSVGHMAPHETREFYLIHSKPTKAIASIESGFFTADPQPAGLSENGGWGRMLRFDKKTSGQCRMFGFLLDANIEKGIHVLNVN